MSYNGGVNNNIDSNPIQWEGNQAFYIAGIGKEDDTLRIKATPVKIGETLTLILPTLCITYADMKFANKINGIQKDYPDSAEYGPQFFDPPVVLNESKQIEEYTWIRGAQEVILGQKQTFIKWWSWDTLVIPKLRIKSETKVMAIITVPNIPISVSQPFTTKILQYADGRHIGGVQLAKRHPNWKPKPLSQKFKIWIRTIDGKTRNSIYKADIKLFTWNLKENLKTGEFFHETTWYTDKMGIVEEDNLICSEKKLLTIEKPQYITQIWRFRPLSDQFVRRTFKLWKSKDHSLLYEFQEANDLESIMGLIEIDLNKILERNNISNINQIKRDSKIKIPCLKAVYHVESRDTLEDLFKRFCYNNVEELAAINKIPKPYKIFQDQELQLMGWCLFIAESNIRFDEVDEAFKLPKGWTRPLQRILHDDNSRAYEHEVIAIPTNDFIVDHKLTPWY